MYRFEKNWNNLRAHRIDLVTRSRANNAYAYAELRETTRRGLLFAIYAVQNAVDKQEAFFFNAVRDMPILYGIYTKEGKLQKGTLPLHIKAVESVDAWMRDHFSIALFDDLSGHTFAAAATKCFGLNWAKAYYAAGCLAFDNCGCLDTHMCRLYGIDQTKIGSRKAYEAAYATTGWTCTLDQWRDFRKVGAFAQNEHDVWFKSVLPNAVTA